MAYQSTRAIVLRYADYRESDRILSLLTPLRGRVDVTARGARKPRSPLLAACQPFTLGEYTLFKGKGHETLTSCLVEDSFYPLREDYERLSYGAVMLAAADAAAQPEEPQEHLMLLLARSLHRLSYTEMKPQDVTAAFLLHFASLQGYKPRLNHCVSCARALDAEEKAWLDPTHGGLVCRSCQKSSAAMPLEAQAVNWLRQVLTEGIDRAGPAPGQAPLVPLKRYVEQVIDRRLPALPEYQAKY